MRLIDADAFKENMERKYGFYARQPQDDIDAQPTVNAVPIVHGHWNHRDDTALKKECSVCKALFYLEAPYCYICGAKMDEKDGENDG